MCSAYIATHMCICFFLMISGHCCMIPKVVYSVNTPWKEGQVGKRMIPVGGLLAKHRDYVHKVADQVFFV